MVNRSTRRAAAAAASSASAEERQEQEQPPEPTRGPNSGAAANAASDEDKKPIDAKSPSSTSSEDKKVLDDYQALCRELNMDSATSDTAWQSYLAIKENYTLEGNPLHWLACALYVACHNSQLPTVGRDGMQIEGNGVSLTRLLRCCQLSLIHFFNKAKKWADMSNLKSQFRAKIDSLERNFAVSNVIFKKYQPIFVHLFKDPAKDPPKQNRSRKMKKPPCTPGDVFNFCWDLFVRVKADFPSISDDLVNSYHLLLSCVDYIYGNAVMGNRFDLLNEEFSGHEALMAASEASEPLMEPPCILDELCKVHDGIISEVKSIREHWWKPHIKKFFGQKILRGDQEKLSCILDTQFFETNAKNVRKDYESYVLSIGEYDERVFLGEDANDEIGTPSRLTSGGDVSELQDQMTAARRNLATQFDGGSGLIPVTPLSGKHYLRCKEQSKITPVSTATYLVSRLNALLGKRTAEPSQRLLELFASCEKNPTEAVTKRVEELGDKFCQKYTSASDHHPGSHESFARLRLNMGVILYYKLLEAILYSEKEKKKPLGNLLEQDIFHQALFTCCLEIVIFSYNSQRTFPWILETFGLEPIHFYKVIEVIIRIEDSLPRDVVKHLQRIEEQILESRTWTSDSPLWAAIKKDPNGVPSCEEVSLPGQSVADPQVENVPGQSPLSHHKRPFSVVKSPMAGDRFKSPVVTAVARRQLAFGEGGGPQIAPTSPVKAGQSVLASPQKTFIQVQGQNIPVSSIRQIGNGKVLIESDGTVGNNENAMEGGLKPKRTGSLGLFFRKFYHLAHLRMDMLCHTLQIMDEDLRRKIWTTFEHTMMKHTELMKDRHLDQLLMCSLYIVCKVVQREMAFADILKQYKTQPQAASHVYRSVLLGQRSGGEATAATTKDKSSGGSLNPPPTPSRMSNTSTVMDGEERGNLIMFYNKIFMERLQKFCVKFKSSTAQAEAPPLSPLPKLRVTPQSPCRKVSENHSVFIRPLKQTPGDVVSYNPSSPHKPLSYSFSRSPAKDLKAINELMRTEVERKTSATVKRLLPPSEEGEEQQQEVAGQTVIVQQDAASGEPPIKVQIVGGGEGAGGEAAGKVNTKLGLILGNRT